MHFFISGLCINTKSGYKFSCLYFVPCTPICQRSIFISNPLQNPFWGCSKTGAWLTWIVKLSPSFWICSTFQYLRDWPGALDMPQNLKSSKASIHHALWNDNNAQSGLERMFVVWSIVGTVLTWLQLVLSMDSFLITNRLCVHARTHVRELSELDSHVLWQESGKSDQGLVFFKKEVCFSLLLNG